MRILLTNDDGIASPGLRALAEELQSVGDVVIYAPEREQSCSGHAITLHKPLRIREAALNGLPVSAHTVSGTPADCVVLANLQEAPPPDLVVSGINAGANLGEEVFYSGTVAAAMEAALHGLRSIAVSVTAYQDCDYRAAARFVAEFAPTYLEMTLPPDTLINVNVPNLPPDEIAGVQVTRLGRRSYENFVEKRDDPRGRPYYWFGGTAQETDSGQGTDIRAVHSGVISVTPLRFDVTAYPVMDDVQEALSALDITQS